MASAQDQIGLIMQLRRRGIRDNKVLRAIERVPRDLFVDEAFADHAYQDIALPIECGQTISQPYVVAFMTEHLELDERHKVLEIGTGSGYQAAVLSHLCRRVYTVERWRELQKAAERRLAKLGITNVTTIIGDGWLGWPPQAPFDRIIVTAAADEAPLAADRSAQDRRPHDHPARRDARYPAACRDPQDRDGRRARRSCCRCASYRWCMAAQESARAKPGAVKAARATTARPWRGSSTAQNSLTAW